jgi:MoxR-like ATPase
MDASPAAPLSAQEARGSFERIARNVEAVMRGQHESVKKLLAAFAAGGHVLIEDFPGTGKTTLAKALAASVGAKFARVQFTPDLLPSDILGVSVFNQRDQSFEFRPGPVFTSILLADEVNRASPRTQSALLEVMAEGQVSTEGRTHRMDELFFVIATQNPVEFRGTYPLPEAQMDRFADEIKHYVVELVRRTRAAPQVALGCGPRASIALAQTAKAYALFEGEDYVRPEHVQSLAGAVLAHRIVVDPQAKFAGVTAASLVAEILKGTAAPA